MKKHFKISLLLFCISLVLLNCENDIIIENDLKQTNDKLSIKIVPWKHLEISNATVAKKIDYHREKNLKNRILQSSIDNFYIDDTSVQIINHDDYTSFTCFVIREEQESNIVENYMYKEFNNGNYEQFLLKYSYTINENDDLILDTNFFEIETISDIDLILNKTGCVPEFINVGSVEVCTESYECFGNGSGGHNTTTAANCKCGTSEAPNCSPPGSEKCEDQPIMMFNGCSGGQSNDNSPNDHNNGNNTTGGSTNNNNTNTQDNTTIAVPFPNPKPIWQPIIDCINGKTINNDTNNTTIDPSIMETLSISMVDWSAMINYLAINNCSEEAQENIIDQLLDLCDCTPCSQMQDVAENAQLRGIFNNLKVVAANNTIKKEVAYVLKKQQDNSYTGPTIFGQENSTGVIIPFGINSQINVFVHTHYTGLLSIFSPDDLKMYYDLIYNGLTDVDEELLFVVITNHGTKYAMRIDNISQFINATEQYFSNDAKFKDFKNDKYKKNIDKNNSKEDNEKGFLKMLQDINIGMTLFKANNDFTAWTELSLDNGNVTEEDCN